MIVIVCLDVGPSEILTVRRIVRSGKIVNTVHVCIWEKCVCRYNVC